MSDLPDSDTDEASFRLASGEELSLPGDDNAPALADPPAPMKLGPRPPRPDYRDRRAAGRLRARKVRRLVRHVEPWSVLKVSLLFYFCLWVILLVAGVIIWSFAVTSGTIDNVENFVTKLFALKSFSFNADEIFRASAIGGLVLVVAGSGFTVLMAVLFNLISDVTGGVRFTVVEEETARPRPKRTRPRHGVARPTVARAPVPAVPVAPERLAAGAEPDPGVDVPILRTAETLDDAETSGDTSKTEVASTPPDR